MEARAESEFRDFVALRSPALMRTAYVLTQNQQRAEDLVQEILAELVRRWDRIHDPEAYARRALYRRQVSWWRRRGLAREITTVMVPDPPVSDQAGAIEERLVLADALRRLTVRQRAVLMLRYLEDLPEKDVAALLGCSVGTVRSQTQRALARMRRLVPELREGVDQQGVR